jgi:hypothetical protein
MLEEVESLVDCQLVALVLMPEVVVVILLFGGLAFLLLLPVPVVAVPVVVMD